MKRTMKWAAALLMCAAIMVLPLSALADFVGSADAKKYHDPKCKAAQSIKKDNLVKFSTAEAAKKLGFEPCEICKPTGK